jgi:hypothetical protein
MLSDEGIIESRVRNQGERINGKHFQAGIFLSGEWISRVAFIRSQQEYLPSQLMDIRSATNV